MARKSEPALLKLFRKKHLLDSQKKMLGMLIPELLALTLVNNRQAIRLLRYGSQYVQGLEIPIEGDDSMVNRWATTAKNPGAYQASATERKTLRTNILSNQEGQDSGLRVEHVSVRAYPVRYHSPQTPDGSQNLRILLVAYHIERHWVYFQVEPLRYRYHKREVDEVTIAKGLLKQDRWSDFYCQLGTIEPENFIGAQVCIHVPHGSALREVFTEYAQTKDDMPPEYSGQDRFDIQVFTRSIKFLRSNYFDLSAELNSSTRGNPG